MRRRYFISFIGGAAAAALTRTTHARNAARMARGVTILDYPAIGLLIVCVVWAIPYWLFRAKP